MKSMKRISFLVIVLLFFIHFQHVNAQNYNAIKLQCELTFIDSISMDIIAISIDSFSNIGGDYYYYNFRQLKPNDYGCYDLAGSWLGDEVIGKPDGTFIFNVYPFSPPDSSDTYRILTRSAMDTPWTFYCYHTINDRLEARVTSIELMSFLGLSDSVKVISLTHKDVNGQVIPDPLNSQHILLSKNYGLIRLPKFDTFLNNPAFYDISGKTNPVTGITNLTTLSIYDYQPGDEIHTVLHAEGFASNSTWYTQSTISRILNRTANPNGHKLTYWTERCSSFYMKLEQDTTPYYSYTHDTINIVYNDSDMPLLEGEPLQPVHTLDPPAYRVTHMGFLNDPNIPVTTVPYKSYNYLQAWNFNGNCYMPVMIDGCNVDEYYFKGLGGPYYDCQDLGYGHSYCHLNYYKKANIEWGTPLNCDSLLQVGLAEQLPVSGFTFYPNPTTGLLTCSIPPNIPCPLNLEFYDLAGRLLVSFSLRNQTQEIDISFLPAGIYGYRLKSPAGEIKSRGKIIRQ